MERPIGKAIILCEQVLEDSRTGNKTLVNTFNCIHGSPLPMRYPRLAVYISLVNGNGLVPVVLNLTKQSEGDILFSTQGNVNFSDPNHVVELVFDLRNLVFESTGSYVFEISADSVPLLETKFEVLHSSNP